MAHASDTQRSIDVMRGEVKALGILSVDIAGAFYRIRAGLLANVFFLQLPASGGWPRLLISSVLSTRRGASSFAQFAKGGNRGSVPRDIGLENRQFAIHPFAKKDGVPAHRCAETSKPWSPALISNVVFRIVICARIGEALRKILPGLL